MTPSTNTPPMGLIRAELQPMPPSKPAIQPVVEWASTHRDTLRRCIPAPLVIPLELSTLEQREVVLAAGRRRFPRGEGVGCSGPAGASPMGDTDPVLRPHHQWVNLNPASPNIPLSVAQ